jgi:hypothetical protein
MATQRTIKQLNELARDLMWFAQHLKRTGLPEAGDLVAMASLSVRTASVTQRKRVKNRVVKFRRPGSMSRDEV